jgi:soluble lytic murein transglycosylase-like protein
MRRRDRAKAHHPHAHTHRAEQRLRRQRRKRRIRSMVLAGAAFVSPNTGKAPVVKSSLAPLTISRSVEQSAHQPRGLVSTHESFHLPQKPTYDDLIKEAAHRHGLPEALIRAVIMTESAFDPLAVSSAGAQGLMQLMPALADEMGVSNVFDPRENIMAGAQYLKSLLEAQKGNIKLALASYNAGPGNVKRYKGIPPFKETRRYVAKIMDLVEESEQTPD